MDDALTIHLDADVRAALERAADAARTTPAEYARTLISGRLDALDAAFRAEARRQCEVLNAAASDPTSDEAAVMRELDALFDADPFGTEWRA